MYARVVDQDLKYSILVHPRIIGCMCLPYTQGSRTYYSTLIQELSMYGVWRVEYVS
jgi:hypothetical protein